jgi:hypothetical protein
MPSPSRPSNPAQTYKHYFVPGMFAIVALLGLAARPASAQRAAPPTILPYHAPAAVLTLGWLASAPVPRIALMPLPPPTHARAGAIVGGLVGGLLGAAVGTGLCHFDAPCPHPAGFAIGGFLLGALAGGGIGYRIGSLFPAFEWGARPSVSRVSPASSR